MSEPPPPNSDYLRHPPLFSSFHTGEPSATLAAGVLRSLDTYHGPQDNRTDHKLSTSRTSGSLEWMDASGGLPRLVVLDSQLQAFEEGNISSSLDRSG